MENILAEKKKIRYDWLDAVKALAMALVIFGHLGLNKVGYYQVYASFIKLPLFFAASGFVFNPKKTDKPLLFIWERVKRILFPYFILCAIIRLFYLAFEGKPFEAWLKESLYIVFTGSIYMWFLPVLFLCNVMMLFAFRALKNKDALIIASAGVSLILGFILLPKTHLIFDVNEALIAYPFCVFGYYYKTTVMKLEKKKLSIIAGVALALYIALPVLHRLLKGNFNYINMFENYYSCFFLDIFIAFCGSVAVFVFFSFLKFPKAVILFGRNTMFYYAFHIPACEALVMLAVLISNNALSTADIKGNILTYCLLTLVTIAALAPICFLTNRYLPFIVGMKKQPQNK